MVLKFIYFVLIVYLIYALVRLGYRLFRGVRTAGRGAGDGKKTRMRENGVIELDKDQYKVK
ncbi:MAG: hypothetical protein MUD12_08070 [Spirochaetes bacterium]|jgi:hypothetical protein|nr:hypothetical protein [Spirochaetota bacterium]